MGLVHVCVDAAVNDMKLMPIFGRNVSHHLATTKLTYAEYERSVLNFFTKKEAVRIKEHGWAMYGQTVSHVTKTGSDHRYS